MATLDALDLAPYLDRLRQLPFVRKIQLAWEPALAPLRPDALVKLRTPRRTFTFALEMKRTFLDHALTSALIAEHIRLLRKHRLPLLLAARYIPRPTGERLAEAGVNFVDRPGNIHLKLGDDYYVHLLGRREARPEPTARRPSPALIQLFFVLLARPETADLPVRKLGHVAGISKTAAATGRQRLVRLGILARGGNRTYRVTDRELLVNDFLTGYVQVLRPHLRIGRFRALERDLDLFLKNVTRAAKRTNVRWGVTGGPAAFALDRFYRGDEIPIFVTPFKPALQRALRLVSDRHGPVTLLRAFGREWAWRGVGDVIVAHPWLIYVELLQRGEPRALEAAEQIREKYLKA